MSDLSATERCVKCGLCLPHCPTFQLTGNEADSPRGRISLMQLLDQPSSTWSPGLFTHLDQCLLCHACEAMCPSKVPYDRLMDSARERLQQHRHESVARRLARAGGFGLLTSAGGRRVAEMALKVVRLVGPERLAGLPGMPANTARLLRLAPPPSPRAAGAAPGRLATGSRGNVNLFTGCTGELFDRSTWEAARRLLGRLGYRVLTPEQQGCCGALHQHNGNPRRARQLASSNLVAFSVNRDPIVSFASGCGAHLLKYRELYPDAEDFSRRVSDIVTFLAAGHAGVLEFRPLAEKAALYFPCTQSNVLGLSALRAVLQWIPDLQLEIVNPQGGCCGAAGSYVLTQPELADRLGDAMADRIAASGAAILLTTNIGCSLHLGARLRRRGVDIDILHPVTLLDSLAL
jgi:glycolate oxidase iron-sulfur subunit